jgi:uncharacterized protein (DUF169 family)
MPKDSLKYKEISENLDKLLDLKSPPVAISIGLEVPKEVKRLKGRLPLCKMLDKARLEGESFYTTAENHECAGGLYSLGFKGDPEEIRREQVKLAEILHDRGVYSSTTSALRGRKQLPSIKPGTTEIVSFSALKNSEFEPNVVVVICNPEQAMRLIMSTEWETGISKARGLSGSICSTVIAAPYLEGEVTYSLGGGGTRVNMKLRDEEMFVGIPAELLKGLVKNLEQIIRR